jgi:hypothetical protein
MNESQMIEDLRSALDDATGHVGARPGMAQRARAGGRRRRAVRGLLAGVPAVALVAGAAFAVHGSAPAATSAGAGVRGSATPQVVTAAYVAKQVEANLAGASNYIIRTVTNSYPGGPITAWTDPRSGAYYDVQGAGSTRSLSWLSTHYVKGSLPLSETDVFYANSTWDETVLPADGTSTPTQGLDVPGGVPAQLAQELKSGKFTIKGHGHVNGHDAIELWHDFGPVEVAIWVDSKTFQPVRFARTLLPPVVPTDFTVTDDEFWTPRTAALVNLVNNPKIPAGFKRVPVGATP